METQRKAGTQFSWKPLIEIPETIPEITFLQGDDAQAFLEEFNATAREQYGDAAEKVAVLSYDAKNKIVRGSNLFATVHADNLLKSQGVRVATMADLEKGLAAGFDLRGTYEDPALVLRSRAAPNEYLATNLANQLDARGTKLGKNPLVVQLRGLQLVRDADSDYGLSFKLTDESEIIEASQLIEKNNGKTFKKLDENSMPILDAEGNRYLYTRKSGLSRLYLIVNLSLGSNSGYLAYSIENGRVAFVRSGEAAGANFLAQLRQKFEAEQSELAGRYEAALKVFKGQN